jgi:DNA replication and repair protein RecF
MDLPAQPVVLLGDNGQGKSNLLEAIYLLATTRSWRTQTDGELIDWRATGESQPFTRIAGQVARQKDTLNLEIAVVSGSPVAMGEAPATGKRIRINGVPRRAIDLVGQVQMVLFGPQDIDLIQGSPQARRRYLDVALSLLDSRYMRSLSRYNRVLTQRNHLLRQIKAGLSHTNQLPFWNDELVATGSYVVWQRMITLQSLEQRALPVHQQLTNGEEQLQLAYKPSLSSIVEYPGIDVESLGQEFARRLATVQDKEISLGLSLLGPHRDDFVFLVNRRALGAYGSRGQQRTAVLSLRLAEVELVRERAGEPPILLLDDVLSELDKARRQQLRDTISLCPQTIVTAIDTLGFDDDMLRSALCLRVVGGKIAPL